MADSTYTIFGAVAESTFGTTPASALQLVNVTSVDFKQSRDVSRPNILTGSRRRHENRVLRKSGELQISAPLQYENCLQFHEGLQNAARGSAVSITATTISFDASTETIADSANGLGSLAVGDWIFVSGAGDAGNNGWKGPILTAAVGAVTFPNGQITATAVATPSITLKTRRLIDGTTLKSYSCEYDLSADPALTNEFRSGTGYRVGSIEWAWSQGSWATEQISLIGKVPAMANATIGTGAATAAPTTGYMNSVDDFQTILFGTDTTASTFSAVATDLRVTVTNTQTPVYGLGTVGPSQIHVGPQDIAVSMTLYYDEAARAIQDLVEAHTSCWMGFDVVDPDGNRMAFSIPAMKPDMGDPEIGEAGTLISLPLTFSGHDPAKDSASLSTALTHQFGIFYVA